MMVRRSWLPLAAAFSFFVAACGAPLTSRPPAVHPTPVAPPPVVEHPVQPPPPPPDATDILIAESQKHFEAGERELKLGHLERARAEFDRAIEMLLESPRGARSEPRLREHFDRLVDRISAFELMALAKGDGFTEKPSEPASIDELLAMATFVQEAAPAGLKQAVQSDLQSTVHDIPIPLNRRVLAYIDLFKGRLKEFLQEGLERGSQYLPMIQNVFRAEGLPLDLAYVPLIESAFKPNALSRAKARGVWQFMRGTALEHGLKADWYVDERSDPEKATRAAASYLKTLHKIFKGDWHLALASYNGGPGRVERAMKRARRTDFWELARKVGFLPKETREYVPMILAAIVVARNPIQYGLTFNTLPPLEYDRVRVASAIDLRRIAEWIQVPVDALQALNPELRRLTTPLTTPQRNPEGWELKVPEGSGSVVEAKLGELPTPLPNNLQWHTVRRGESLATIANKRGVKRADLAEANYLPPRSRVSPGQKLVIPREPGVLLAAQVDRPAPVAESRDVAPAEILLAQTPGAEQSGRVKLQYRVKRGDTLSSIAKLYRTTVASLRSWNKLRSSRIIAGDVLTIFASGPVARAAASSF
ncbi:MAG: LysM peptidoglycan-binding domain-containing protein [Acidobacteria bacterium]|nr:LysM peptidoglycan-binding domain-containing protein [Acidobacteriota bacterium]